MFRLFQRFGEHVGSVTQPSHANTN
jgi:sortase (surface protein transpeptidase)